MQLDSQQVQLQDIVIAPAAQWWPLAPGWYVLIGSVLVLVIYSVWGSIRAVKRRRARRAALQQLTALQQQPDSNINDITLLLKQAALAYFPQACIHNTDNAAWWAFVGSQLSTGQQRRYQALLAALQQASYQPVTAQQQWLTAYYEFADLWLRQALPPSRKRYLVAIKRGQS